MQRLKAELGGAKRVQSQGVMVLSDRFVSHKATRALIETDVREREHVPVQRKRQTTDAFEEGFLVIGANAITFLGKDKSVVSSHPLNFLETYCIDLHDGKTLTYTIRQVHFLTKEEIESRAAGKISELLRSMTGVRIGYTAPLQSEEIAFLGCPSDNVSVWIDGQKMTGTVGEILPLITPSDIAGLEVYQRQVLVPPEYRDNSCAAIVMWTR